MPCSSSYRWIARAKIAKMNTAPNRAAKGSTGRAVSSVFSMDISPYTHTGTAAAAITVRGVRGLPLSPAAARISSQAPMAHMAASNSMVAQDGAQPRISIRSGRLEHRISPFLNFCKGLFLYAAGPAVSLLVGCNGPV